MNALDGAIWRSYFLLNKKAEQISKYKEHIDKVKYDKINFPVKLKDIPKIENINDIRLNVFGVDDYKLFILFIILKMLVIKLVICF